MDNPTTTTTQPADAPAPAAPKTIDPNKAVAVAFTNATYAASLLSTDDDVTDPANGWPQLQLGDSKTGFAAAQNILAPFVRQNPEAPPEALYRHAADAGVHGADPNGWHALPLALRFAYGLFATTLVYTDRVLERQTSARQDSAGRKLRRAANQAMLGDGLKEGTLAERTDADGVDAKTDVNATTSGNPPSKRKPQIGISQRARREREQKGKANVDPNKGLTPAQQHAAALSTELHATDASGKSVPTLSDRIRQEGFKRQQQVGKAKAEGKSAKPKKARAPARPKAKRERKPTLAQRNKSKRSRR